MNVTNVSVNLMLHGGNRVHLVKTEYKHADARISQQTLRRIALARLVTFALKSLTSSERKSMSLISDRINSLEEKSRMMARISETVLKNMRIVFKERI